MKTLEKREIEKPRISYGNKKLPKNTAIFNILAVKTCPMATEFCKANCYALKAEKQYKNVVPQARKRNLKASQQESFVSDMIGLIAKGQKKINQFRIHESGDFYSQIYIDRWFMIAKEFPSITFYAYTKSFHLDFSGKPSNFVLIASFDESTTERARMLYNMKKEAFDNTFSIVGKSEKASCVQDCSKCDLCWSGKGLSLTVNVH